MAKGLDLKSRNDRSPSMVLRVYPYPYIDGGEVLFEIGHDIITGGEEWLYLDLEQVRQLRDHLSEVLGDSYKPSEPKADYEKGGK